MDSRSRLVMWLVAAITLLTGCGTPATPAPGPARVPIAVSSSTRAALPTMTLPLVPVVIAIPDVVSGGTLVTLEGSNLRPNDHIMFYLRDPAKPTEPILQIGTGQTAADGRFTWSFTYPTDSRWTSISAASVIVQSTATGGYITVPLQVVVSGTIPTINVPTPVSPTLTSLSTPTFTSGPTSTPVVAAPVEDTLSLAKDEGHRPDVAQQIGFSGSLVVIPNLSIFTSTQAAGCDPLIAGHTTKLGKTEYTIPAMVYFCLDGFQPGSISIQLIRPDGTLRPSSPQSIPFTSTERYNVMIPLIEPPGLYTVTVTQSNLMAAGIVELGESPQPRIVIFPPVAPSDAAFTIYLAGFAPNARVMLNEYHTANSFALTIPSRFDYIQSFSVNTDARGQAVATANLRGPDGQYLLRTDDGSFGYFRLGRSVECASTDMQGLKVCAYTLPPEAPQLPDLVATDVTLSGNRIDCMFRNTGSAEVPAQDLFIDVYVNDERVNHSNVGFALLPLAPGAQATTDSVLQRPITQSARVKCIVDADNRLAEADETNNQLQKIITPPVTAPTGNWTNEDPNTGGITRIVIRNAGNNYEVQTWGQCHPTECYWNEYEGVTYTVTDVTPTSATITWIFNFVVTTLKLEVLADGRLQVLRHNHFTDNSGRRDADYTYYFKKTGE